MEGHNNDNAKESLQPGNFCHLYKYKPTKSESQESRRQQLLEQQKKSRRLLQDSGRILELIQDSQCLEESKSVSLRNIPKKDAKNPNKSANAFRDQLMFSEWMEGLPSNLEQNWVMVPCPVGMRMLIVACNGRTRAYTKRGKFQYEFLSYLPGGGHEPNVTNCYKNTCTVLDCIYSTATEIFYILDLLAWGNQPFLDCELEFRFFWLEGKLSENEKVSQRNLKWNPYPFILLPHYACQEQALSSALCNWPVFENNNPPLDGLLFFHKNASYTPGVTPTVLWLLPFMIPEVISPRISIHSQFIESKPTNYENQKEFITKFIEEQKQKKASKWRLKRDSKRIELNAVISQEESMTIDDSTSENALCEQNTYVMES